MELSTEQRLDAIEREGDRIIDLATPSNLEREIPGCPGWSFLELVRHLARVYDWAGTIVEGQLQEPPHRSPLAKGAGGDATAGVSAVDWLSDRLVYLTTAIRTTPPNARIWNFGPNGSGGPDWWARRQMNETTIHRVDAEAGAEAGAETGTATGARASAIYETHEVGQAITPVEPAVAADIVDEVFELQRFTEVEPDDLHEAGGVWVHLHATDLAGAEWTVDSASRRLTKAHMKGDVALRGPTWALARWLWGRLPARPENHRAEIEIFGDLEAADSWRRTLSL